MDILLCKHGVRDERQAHVNVNASVTDSTLGDVNQANSPHHFVRYGDVGSDMHCTSMSSSHHKKSSSSSYNMKAAVLRTQNAEICG